ncbi:hypothetical protein BZA77DRAFT_319011, partial [Pyronema omphalodes]
MLDAVMLLTLGVVMLAVTIACCYQWRLLVGSDCCCCYCYDNQITRLPSAVADPSLSLIRRCHWVPTRCCCHRLTTAQAVNFPLASLTSFYPPPSDPVTI